MRDVEAVREAVQGVERLSPGGHGGAGRRLRRHDDYVSHNDLGTAALLPALHERRFGGPIVVASSMVVYGEGGYRCQSTTRSAQAPARR